MSDAANVIEVQVRPPSNFPARAPATPPAAPAPAPAAPAPAPSAAPAEAPAPAPAAPAPAPVAAAPASFAPAPPPPVPDAPQGDVRVEYSPTKDKGLDLALRFVGGLGFGPERPDMKAAMSGDFGPLAESLKALGDKAAGYEGYLEVAKESYGRIVSQRKSAEDKINDAVVKAAGGPEAWNAIHAWVQAEASDEQKAEITAALKAGSYAAQAMVAQLAQLYKQSGKSELPPKSAVKEGVASAPAAAGGGALSPQQYKEEIRRLEAKYGYRLQETDDYRNAVARRLQYKPQQ